MSPLLRKIIIGLTAFIVAAGAFFYFSWKRSPEYAAGEIYHAVTARDFRLLQERVDLSRVYNEAVDDLADVAAESDKREHRIASGLMKTLRRPLVHALIEETENSFRPSLNEQEPSLFAPVTDAIQTYVGTAAVSFTDILEVVQTGDTATVSVKLHDRELDRDFTWKVLLEKDVNEVWTAVKVLNFKEYLIERKALLDAKK